MFENNIYLTSQTYAQMGYNSSETQNQTGKAALQLYHQSSLRGWFGKMWAILSGRSNRLIDLNAFEANSSVGERHYAGVQTVSLDQIRGSEGRCQDFDANFNPLNESTRDRWVSVAKARQQGIALPAVELIQIGKVYFVRDGHHRISVARSFGEKAIEAEVTIVKTSLCQPREPKTAACKLCPQMI